MKVPNLKHRLRMLFDPLSFSSKLFVASLIHVIYTQTLLFEFILLSGYLTEIWDDLEQSHTGYSVDSDQVNDHTSFFALVWSI